MVTSRVPRGVRPQVYNPGVRDAIKEYSQWPTIPQARRLLLRSARPGPRFVPAEPHAATPDPRSGPTLWLRARLAPRNHAQPLSVSVCSLRRHSDPRCSRPALHQGGVHRRLGHRCRPPREGGACREARGEAGGERLVRRAQESSEAAPCWTRGGAILHELWWPPGLNALTHGACWVRPQEDARRAHAHVPLSHVPLYYRGAVWQKSRCIFCVVPADPDGGKPKRSAVAARSARDWMEP